MKSKQILMLGIVLAALLLVVMVGRLMREPAQTQIEEETLVGKFEPSAVASIEFYHGARPGETVKLKKDGSWVVPSKYGARADEKRINNLLDDLRGLSGEVRADSEELLGDFGITEDLAVHLIIKDSVGSQITHLLIGKAGPDWRSSFVRSAGSSSTYLVNVGLLSRLGVGRPAEGPVTGIDDALWLDLTIAPGVDWKKATALSLRSPRTELSFKRVVEEGDRKKVDPQTAQWEVTAEGVPYAAQSQGVRGLLRSLENLRAEEVADPAKKDRYAFAQARHIATLTFEDNTTKKILVGKEAPEKDNRKRFYLKVEGERIPLVAAEHVVDRLFENAKKLLKLKVLSLSEKDVKSVALKDPHKALVLSRSRDGRWHVSEPALGFEEQKDAAKRLAKKFLAFEPDDLLNRVRTIPGSGTPEYSALIELEKGSTRTISVYGEIEGTDGARYARVDGADTILSVNKHTLKALFPDLTALLRVRLADLDRNMVKTLQVERGKQKFVLRREPCEECEDGHEHEHHDKWTLEILGHTFDANAKKAQGILMYFAAIWPNEVLGTGDFSKYGLDKPVLTVTASDGKKTATILVGKKEETRYYAAQKENRIVFTIVDKGVETAMAKLSELATLRLFPAKEVPDSVKVHSSKVSLTAKRTEIVKDDRKVKVWAVPARTELNELNSDLMAKLISEISRLKATDIIEKIPEKYHRRRTDFIALGMDGKTYKLQLHARNIKEKTRYCLLEENEGAFVVKESRLKPIFKEAVKLTTDTPRRSPKKQ